MIYSSLNINYMLPAGASLVHPHMQVLNSPMPSSHQRLLIDKSSEFASANTPPYWAELVSAEKQVSERYIGQTGEAHLVTAFSPTGYNEIHAVWPEKQNFLQFSDQDIQDLSEGLSHILKVFQSMNLSSLNFSCFCTPLRAIQRFGQRQS